MHNRLAGTVWPSPSSEGHWAEVRTCSWLCTVAGTAFHMLIPDASISLCASWHHWSNLLIHKVSWETQACKFPALYQSFLTRGRVCGCHWHFCNCSAWTEELMHFRHTKHPHKAESHGTKPATQFGPHLGTGVTHYSNWDGPAWLRLSHENLSLRVKLGKHKILQI